MLYSGNLCAPCPRIHVLTFWAAIGMKMLAASMKLLALLAVADGAIIGGSGDYTCVFGVY